MTKKDYQLVASAIKQTAAEFADDEAGSDEISEVVLACVAARLAERFGFVNPRFDRVQFIEACKFDGG